MPTDDKIQQLKEPLHLPCDATIQFKDSSLNALPVFEVTNGNGSLCCVKDRDNFCIILHHRTLRPLRDYLTKFIEAYDKEWGRSNAD